ncbi:hypothetical protein KK137_00040 [Croceibacterium sp. LX-88]|uniref:Uncharacterized protein n=1 Tax=Croceibacterium selenioxidans TaxID=2838833 RepID=A0ABS5VYV0_9SPHN|nr:zinc ribbon domain-containing protein [Croceibacterium selenioxidans]MBT2132708.1 hypothetical protein [Croceibacterium selenioxidans]
MGGSMRVWEKACPRCRETIKKAAHLCKHCGHRFSEAEIAAGSNGQQNNTIKGLTYFAIVVGLVLLARFCASDKDGSKVGNASSDTKASENPYADGGKQVAWIEVSKDAIRTRLRDPDSAQFREVHFYSGGKAPVACGEVNAKNGFGGYTGYERFVAAGNVDGLAFLASDLTSSSEMDKVWETMCVKAPTDSQ